MKHLFCWVVYILLFPIILFANPKLLIDFNEVFKSLYFGEKVRVIIDYSKCKFVSDTNKEFGPNAIGGMNIDNFEYFAKESMKNELAYISSSQTVLIFHPRYGYVLNYIKLKIFENNSITIIARYLHPISFEVKMDETFTGYFSTDNNDKNGIRFYKIE